MQAIMSESLPIIDILIRNGEKARRCYGSNKMTAYHYAVQEEKWASLAQLIRLEGYPAARAGFHTPLELAKYMAYWRCVSILEEELKNPGFWQLSENAVYCESHKRLGRLRKPAKGSEEMEMLERKWENDRIQYENLNVGPE